MIKSLKGTVPTELGKRKEVDNAVTAVENRIHEVMLTAMENVVIRELKWP